MENRWTGEHSSGLSAEESEKLKCASNIIKQCDKQEIYYLRAIQAFHVALLENKLKQAEAKRRAAILIRKQYKKLFEQRLIMGRRPKQLQCTNNSQHENMAASAEYAKQK